MTRGEPARRERPASKVHRYAWLCDARAALAADARPLRSVQTPDHLDDFDDFCAVLMAGQVIKWHFIAAFDKRPYRHRLVLRRDNLGE